MIATERKGRLRRISDLNILTIEADSKRWRFGVAAFLDRVESNPLLAVLCLVCLVSPILAFVAVVSVYVAIVDRARPPVEGPAAILAQEYRDRGARMETLWRLYSRQAKIPGRSTLPGDGLSLMPGTWQQRADNVHGLFERYRKLAIEQERINQGFPPR